jgi:hypothetical protein
VLVVLVGLLEDVVLAAVLVVVAFFAGAVFLAVLVVLVGLLEDVVLAVLLEGVCLVALLVPVVLAGALGAAVLSDVLLVSATGVFGSVVVVEGDVVEVDAEDGAELPGWLAGGVVLAGTLDDVDVVLAGAVDDDVVLAGVFGVSVMDDSPVDVKGG